MRTIYLVRHCEPDFYGDEKRCLGQRTDRPLSARGIDQALRLKAFFEDKYISAVYCSPLGRAEQTAQIMAGDRYSPELLAELCELDTGEWDGLPFSVIRREYAQLYRARDEDNSLSPPAGESYASGCERIRRAIEKANGDCVIVAHAGINRALLCELTETPFSRCFSIAQPYGCISVLHEDGGVISAESVGELPNSSPDEEELLRLYQKAETPESVILHCKATAALADEMAHTLNLCGGHLDIELIDFSAKVHDIMRASPDHAQAGADYLSFSGYSRASEIVRTHHDLLSVPDKRITEAEVVYLADKLIKETDRVSLSERYSHSTNKCRDDFALQNHLIRYNTAIIINEKIKAITGIDYGETGRTEE